MLGVGEGMNQKRDVVLAHVGVSGLVRERDTKLTKVQIHSDNVVRDISNRVM